jgi:hypothetical protein
VNLEALYRLEAFPGWFTNSFFYCQGKASPGELGRGKVGLGKAGNH